MRCVALFSGGKDSTFSIFKAQQLGHEIVGLLTVKPLRQDSWMFHYPCVDLTSLQSEAMGLPLRRVVTSGVKEEELRDLSGALSKLKKEFGFEAVISGAVESQYQKTRIDRICEENGLFSLTPIWHREPEGLLFEMLNSGFEIVFTAVAAEGFTEDWLNRKLDFDALRDLKRLNRKFGVHLSLEGGEGETFVKDAPNFKKRVEFIEVEKVWSRDSGYIVVKRARLTDKAQNFR